MLKERETEIWDVKGERLKYGMLEETEIWDIKGEGLKWDVKGERLKWDVKRTYSQIGTQTETLSYYPLSVNTSH